jgi:hypothetical protein
VDLEWAERDQAVQPVDDVPIWIAVEGVQSDAGGCARLGLHAVG